MTLSLFTILFFFSYILGSTVLAVPSHVSGHTSLRRRSTFSGRQIPSFQNNTTPDNGNSNNNNNGVCAGSSRGCWTGNFTIETDPEQSWPNTGKTVEYTFNITNTTCSPDGIPKPCLLVNNQYPGPTVLADWGDMVKIVVNNNLQDNGTSIHWHGIRQFNTNSQDGVNGITECPIPPGASRTYVWQATDHGTSWYHSHFSAQYGDGIQGAIVINGPKSAGYDVDVGPITISEIYNKAGSTMKDIDLATIGPIADLPNNILFNGTNVNAKGGGERMKIQVEPGKKYLLRFVNTGVSDFYKVTVDGHDLQVVAIDFTPVQPYYTKFVSLGVGQRFEAILTANQTVGNYWLRAIPQSCVANLNDGLGDQNMVISYVGSGNGLPTSKVEKFLNECVDEPLEKTVPIPARSVDPATFDPKHIPIQSPLKMTSKTEGRVFRWTLGNSTADTDWQNPILLRVLEQNNTLIPEDNIVSFDQKNQWVYYYIQSNFAEPHPLHMHGNTLRVLKSGYGQWDENVNSLQFQNPMRRDTFMVPAGGHAVLGFFTDSPGAWLLHCHIAFHVSEGLSSVMVVRRQEITLEPTLKTQLKDQCTSWTNYYQTQRKYDKIGSGL